MDVAAVAADVDAFYAAFADGNVACLAAFFARAAVRSLVVKTNAYVLAQRPDDDVFATRDARGWLHYVYPWYYTTPPSGVLAAHKFLPGIAIENGHYEVIAWLFARSQMALMGETLAVVLPLCARFAINTSEITILELLLTSPAFVGSYCSGSRRQDLLDAMLTHALTTDFSDDEIINLLIAHGAQESIG